MTPAEKLYQKTIQLDIQLSMLERIIRSRNPLEAVEAERIRVYDETQAHAKVLGVATSPADNTNYATRPFIVDPLNF